jgi:hypothetical protein
MDYGFLSYICIHYYNSWLFSQGFLEKKKPKNDRCKKLHLVNLDKSIWTCQHDWAVNLDLHVILIDKVTNCLISRQ